ncbi:Aste57867_22031 [Aphanomyces stellatus]|uniref:Aste57867_22031 protein n=1 Tax=Aphanomyces stellatus TaxID=120398 RepID=A0A485LP21_9STRA|nr:hypothetical protein As57867_021962 [Aphanomyces stellatus]VFT98699.1 Aste57867_22031 [Aphanomyces stellatus]
MNDEMPRRGLQAAAKERGIKENQSSDRLRQQLAEYDANLNEGSELATSDEEYDKPNPSGVIPGEVMIDLVAPLMGISHQHWDHAHVLRLAERVSGNSVLDGRSSVRNREGAMLFGDIEQDLTEYMASHADIRRLLDPYYVMFDHPLAANFDQAIAAYPVPNSPIPPLDLADPNVPYVFSFQASAQGRRNAHQLIGHVQALCPGQSVHTFTSVVFSQF